MKKRITHELAALSELMPESVPLSAIAHDGSYQRPVNAKRVARMAATYNPALFSPIVVSLREDGLFYVVDGQHRVGMLRAVPTFVDRDIIVPCRVLRGLTVAEEAALYVTIDDLPVGLNPIQRYAAAFAANEPAAVAITEALARIGRKVGRARSDVRCVKALYWVHARGRLDSALAIADVWATATEDDSAFSAAMIKLVATFLMRVPGVDIDRAGKAFAKMRPSAVEAQLASVVGMSLETVATTMLVDLYNARLRTGRVSATGAARA